MARFGLCSRAVRRVALGCLLGLCAVSAHAFPAEGVAPINNRDYGKAVQQLIRKSKKSIRLMLYQTRYYGEYPDTLTNFLLVDLIEAKKRGVDVEIVVDTGSWNPSKKNEYNTDFVDRLTTSGIEVWEDSPKEVSHEKVICIDDDITVVSSHNWTFYSLANNNEVAVTVFSKPLNAWFQDYFKKRCAAGKPHANVKGAPGADTKPAVSLGAKDLAQLHKLPAADVKPVANRDFYPAVHEALIGAKKSINVVQISMTVYASRPQSQGQAMLPGEPASETNVLVQDLIAAKKRGVKVRVVLDKSEIHDDSANLEAARLLQENGVEVFQDDPKVQTHAKMLTVDDDKAIVGSTNWTYSAIEEGNEASVLITSPEINKVYRDYVETLLKSAVPYAVESKSIWDSGSSSKSRAD